MLPRVALLHAALALLAGASVILLLLCVLVLLATKTDAVPGAGDPGGDLGPGEAVVRKPGPSNVRMGHVRRLADAVAEGEQISLVRFVSERNEVLRVDAAGNPPHKRFPLATRIMDQLRADKPHQFWIGGTFTPIALLHRSFFTRWGPVKETVDVNLTWGGDKHFLRLAALLPGGVQREQDPPQVNLPVEPVTVLAIMRRSSKTPADGHFIGPLIENDVHNIPELVSLLTKEPFGKITARRAGELLDSPNPWVAWLGLARLGDLKVLRTKHFARAIRCRVPGDVEAIFREILSPAIVFRYPGAILAPDMHADLSQRIVSLGHTPEMQEKVLRVLLKWLHEHRAANHGSTHPIDLPTMKQAARDYREKVKDDPAYRGVVRQLDALIALP